MAVDYTKFDVDIKRPVVPCLVPLPKYMEANLGFRIKGTFKSNGKQFSIALLQEDGSTSPLTITMRYDGSILRTDYTEDGYGPTEDDGKHPFTKGGKFDILIICRNNHFEIFLNNKYFSKFVHRSPFYSILDMEIYGDITLEIISFFHYSRASTLTPGAPPPAPDEQRPASEMKIPLAQRSGSHTGLRAVPPPNVGGTSSGVSLGVVSYESAPGAAPKRDPVKVVMPPPERTVSSDKKKGCCSVI